MAKPGERFGKSYLARGGPARHRLHRARRRVIQVFARTLLGGAAILWMGATSGCSERQDTEPKVIILGFDGMDPRLCERLMDEGRLPHFAKMREQGGYSPLATSIPPQSPVAWSNFITGAGPGVHGIFDFIHRDPKQQCRPYFSAAETVESEDGWEVGKHRLPLTFWPFNHNPTQTLLKRHGTPFWDYLDEAGIPIKIYDIPSNYPPSPSHHGHMCCLSGMGVPDLLGGYGTYQFFSEKTPRVIEEDGGMRRPIVFFEDRARAVLIGPKNTTLKRPIDEKIEFDIYRHPTQAEARIELQGQTIVLEEGEWSDWRKVEFDMEMPSFLPNERVSGICRFYLQEVRPNFRLYVTPINIDPSDPGSQRISEPPKFVTQIADQLGLFYTTGFQEDHKALSNHVFSDHEYLEQAGQVLLERRNLYQYAVDHYEHGLLFFYFSSTDQQAHMFWWEGNEPHPFRQAEEARRFHGVIEDLYVEADGLVGDILSRFGGSATVLVMSDHGFCNFRRQFHLNTWLRDNGFVQPATARSLLAGSATTRVDWSSTRAYGLGLNGLYVNLKGRERDGIVDPNEKGRLLDEIGEKLLAVRDPQNGEPVISEVYRSSDVYQGPQVTNAPDLIVGYSRGYRASWSTTLGDMSDGWLTDNEEAWSADHCIAAELVPGVIFSNRPIVRASPSLVDLAPTILTLFGVDVPASMVGGSLFESAATARADAKKEEPIHGQDQD